MGHFWICSSCMLKLDIIATDVSFCNCINPRQVHLQYGEKLRVRSVCMCPVALHNTTPPFMMQSQSILLKGGGGGGGGGE